MGSMFKGCSKLKEIKGINNFSPINTSFTDDIFEGCNELIYKRALSKNNMNNLNVNKNNQKINQLNDEIKKLKGEINNTIAINFFSVSKILIIL